MATLQHFRLNHQLNLRCQYHSTKRERRWERSCRNCKVKLFLAGKDLVFDLPGHVKTHFMHRVFPTRTTAGVFSKCRTVTNMSESFTFSVASSVDRPIRPDHSRGTSSHFDRFQFCQCLFHLARRMHGGTRIRNKVCFVWIDSRDRCYSPLHRC